MTFSKNSIRQKFQSFSLQKYWLGYETFFITFKHCKCTQLVPWILEGSSNSGSVRLRRICRVWPPLDTFLTFEEAFKLASSGSASTSAQLFLPTIGFDTSASWLPFSFLGSWSQIQWIIMKTFLTFCTVLLRRGGDGRCIGRLGGHHWFLIYGNDIFPNSFSMDGGIVFLSFLPFWLLPFCGAQQRLDLEKVFGLFSRIASK